MMEELATSEKHVHFQNMPEAERYRPLEKFHLSYEK